MSGNLERLNNTIADVLGLDSNDVNETLSKKTCEEWDSFNHIVLMDEIERVMDMKITMEESEKIDSYTELIQLLSEKGVL